MIDRARLEMVALYGSRRRGLPRLSVRLGLHAPVPLMGSRTAFAGSDGPGDLRVSLHGIRLPAPQRARVAGLAADLVAAHRAALEPLRGALAGASDELGYWLALDSLQWSGRELLVVVGLTNRRGRLPCRVIARASAGDGVTVQIDERYAHSAAYLANRARIEAALIPAIRTLHERLAALRIPSEIPL